MRVAIVGILIGWMLTSCASNQEQDQFDLALSAFLLKELTQPQED